MGTVGAPEIDTQIKVIQLFKNELGYDYLGDWRDRDNSNIEIELLTDYLKSKSYSEKLIGKAIKKIKSESNNLAKGLYTANQEIYNLLKYGVKVKEEVGDHFQTVYLIDWDNFRSNHFAIAEEVTIIGKHNKRPDIVLYVNGIALGVIELKRSKVFVEEGIRQNLDNQSPEYIMPFFTTIQLIMAGNESQGLRYGVIETPQKYYLEWKRQDFDDKLYDHLKELCSKDRLLELIHDFIIYDAGTKKISRHNQYFAMKASQDRIAKREDGIIWHSQGSGKSIIMLFLANWILLNKTNSRVLIITDRTELDEQIELNFNNAGRELAKAISGKDLLEKLNQASPSAICSLIHKFGVHEEDEVVADYIKELLAKTPDFKPKGDIYVFVDECHRTHSGELHKAMKTILPNAMFIGFTGTPLLKKDKQKSIEVFGSYIHTYKFNEAVEDKVILDLRYEARDIDQRINNQHKIDQWFDANTKGLTENAKIQLKKRWGTMQRILSCQDRLEKIVGDIIFDFSIKDRLSDGTGNAMLVSGSIYQACKLYELFLKHGFKKCAIVTSYVPSITDTKGETTGTGQLSERLYKYEIYQKMLNGETTEEFEKEVKKKFVKEPGQMKLLIVVDKLLTGFDAPSATYLYLDKKMQDHGLFQAICRVNRLDGESKEYGYIIDYKDLFNSLEKAVDDYTAEAFDNYDKEDVAGLLQNRLEDSVKRLDESLDAVIAVCEPVEYPRDLNAYARYFCGDTQEKLSKNEKKRQLFYKLVASLIRSYASIANEMEEAGYTEEEIIRIKKDVSHYTSLRDEIKIISSDYIDIKAYEPAMRHLIDMYISADDSVVLSDFMGMTLIDLIINNGKDIFEVMPKGIKGNKEASAETIENNMRKIIIDEMPTNPAYFDKMSTLLEELIKLRREQAIQYAEYLDRITKLASAIKNGSQNHYPEMIKSQALRSLYDNLNQNEDLAIKLDESIRASIRDNWRGNPIKERAVKYAVKKMLPDVELANKLYNIVKEQAEY
ncbi:MAG: type I restriction endonuclease subunit R [Candidatus Cloacimonetes bacterium]|nr:type I restriction endonuclease subunit R [Candidatus Cloacimonadota bacterium]